MTVDEKAESRLSGIFPGAIIEVDHVDRTIMIRTDQWMIDSDQMHALRKLGLIIDFIMTEGGGVITLAIDKESSNNLINIENQK